MNDILGINPDSQARPISLGEDNASSQISFQLAQDFYNEITGKSEEIEENIELPIIVNMGNIEQLNNRIHQSIEQYNVVSLNYSISVKYINDSSERYSSIERFRLHAGNKGKAVDTISLEYRLLIVLPKVQRPQEYKITVSLESREAQVEGMKDGFGKLKFGFPIHFFEKSTTASFKIEFIDISVARAIMTVLKDWVESLDKTQINETLKIIRSKSAVLPTISKYIFLFASFYTIIQYSNIYFSSEIIEPNKVLALYIVTSSMVLFIMYRVGITLGRLAEHNLDSLYESSYINLSSCDEKLVLDSKRARKTAAIKSVVSVIFTFAFGVAASVVANNFS